MNKKELIYSLELENTKLKKENIELNEKIKSFDINELEKTKEQIKSEINSLKKEVSFIEGMHDDIEFGIYNPEVNFLHNNYIDDWDNARKRLRELSKDKSIINITVPMKLGGSEKKGVKLQNDIVKLGIVHINNVANIQFKNTNQVNYEKQIDRFEKEFNKVNKIFTPLNVQLSSSLKDEIINSFDLVIKMNLQKEEEKEEARLEREKIREEEKLKKEIDNKLEKIDFEVEKFEQRILKIKNESNKKTLEKNEEIKKLQDEIFKLKNNGIELNDRLKRTGSGYVYIISNIGSFGENIYKIGVTRRLEPEIRIRELSSASVPFIFDKHALIWSEKAFILENKLHKAFKNSRVNKVNNRKEFFKTNLDLIKSEVNKITDTSIKWIDKPEAIQYRLTLESEDK